VERDCHGAKEGEDGPPGIDAATLRAAVPSQSENDRRLRKVFVFTVDIR